MDEFKSCKVCLRTFYPPKLASEAYRRYKWHSRTTCRPRCSAVLARRTLKESGRPISRRRKGAQPKLDLFSSEDAFLGTFFDFSCLTKSYSFFFKLYLEQKKRKRGVVSKRSSEDAATDDDDADDHDAAYSKDLRCSFDNFYNNEKERTKHFYFSMSDNNNDSNNNKSKDFLDPRNTTNSIEVDNGAISPEELDELLGYEDDDYIVPEDCIVDPLDAIAEQSCEGCGARLSIKEWIEFESECSNCVHENTQGLIDDTEDELDS